MQAILYSVVWEAFSERWCVSWNPNDKVSQPYQNLGRPFQVTIVSHHVSVIVSNTYKHSTQIHFDRWAWGRNTNGGPKPEAHITYVYVVSNDTILQIKRNISVFLLWQIYRFEDLEDQWILGFLGFDFGTWCCRESQPLLWGLSPFLPTLGPMSCPWKDLTHTSGPMSKLLL